MTATTIVTLIAMILVSGGVTAGLFQLVKSLIPEKRSTIRRVAAWFLALIIALATSYLAGDVWHVIGAWGDGTLTAATLFAYSTGIWGVAEGLYRLWYKTSPQPTIASVNKAVSQVVGEASSVIASAAAAVAAAVNAPSTASGDETATA